MKGFKFRCFPTATQQLAIHKTFGCCRVVWNHLLVSNDVTNSAPIASLNSKLVALKKLPEYAWLNDVSSIALQQTAINLSRAFFQLQRPPNFKSKRHKNSFKVVGFESIRLKEKELYLPKDKESLAIKWTRDLPCQPSSYTLSKTKDGKYWVSFTCEYTPVNTVKGKGIIGIDLGIKDLVVDSDGNKYINPRFYKKSQKAILAARNIVSRRKPGSKRQNKANLRFIRKITKLANQRKDYIHKLTRKLVNENQVIGIEDLNVCGMVKNGKLGGALLDSGLGMFKRFLEYKASESAHTVIVKMNRWEPSTQTCNACGERVSKKLTLAIREWECEFCGALHDRDVNAGLNIKRVASFMSSKYSYPGGSIVLAPPLLHLVNILPRTAVCAQ